MDRSGRGSRIVSRLLSTETEERQQFTHHFIKAIGSGHIWYDYGGVTVREHGCWVGHLSVWGWLHSCFVSSRVSHVLCGVESESGGTYTVLTVRQFSYTESW